MNNTIRHFGVLGAYALLTLALAWPVLLHINDRVVGMGGDPWQTMWRFETKANLLTEAWANQKLGLFITQEFFGGGGARLINLSVWPWMIFHFIFGQPFTYNLIWLLSFILSGWGMYLLVKQLQSKTWPAFVAGLFYMLLPFHVAHAQGHFGAMQAQWLPFILFTGLIFWRNPSTLKALGLCALLVIQAWTEHHYFLWLIIFLLIVAAVYFRQLVVFWQKLWRAPGAIVVVTACLFLIFFSYLPTMRLSFEEDQALALGSAQTIRFSADVLAYFIPSPFHPLWGSFFYSTVWQKFTGNISEAVHFIGFLPILILILFWRHVPGRQKYFWLAVMSIFGVISLGPRLHIFGWVTSIPLPYTLIDSWPVFSAVRAVARASVMVGVSVAILLGLTASRVFQRSWQLAALSLIILGEFLFIPTYLQAVAVSPVYQELSSTPGKNLLEIPAGLKYELASQVLYASNYHKKNLLGNIALERGSTDDDIEVLRRLPGVRHLYLTSTRTLDVNRPEFGHQPLAEVTAESLRWLDVGAIILHKNFLPPEKTASLRRFLEEQLNLKSIETSDAFLYKIDTTWQAPPTDGVFLVRGEGWHSTYFEAAEQSFNITAEPGATVSIINLNQKAVAVTFSFDLTNSGEAHESFTQTVQPGMTDLKFNNHSSALVLHNFRFSTEGL